MFEILQLIHQYFIIPVLVVLLIVWLSVLFIWRYRNPAKRLSGQLQSAIDHVQTLQKDTTKNQLKQRLETHFADQVLHHPWQMYQSTLHEIKQNKDGEDVVIGFRSTASSEYFFSPSLVVDMPLRTEFFKHIPSIMTGIGIIGTFFGLLLGLSQFDPAGDPANIQNSLALLLHGVRDAFLASLVAISAAMMVTWHEKAWLRACYAKLEELTSAIDGLFEADTLGEEYLEQLVQSAQDSATQTKQLKDSLVSDLKAMMENLTAAQKESQQELARQLIESSAKNSTDMASQIGLAITESLQAPLEKIAGSVQQVSGDQGSAVQDLLTDVLTAFMNRLESTFGTQMSGMSEMMGQSVSAMREMQLGFNQLITDMRNGSEASSQALEQQMFSMLGEIQQKQSDMGNTMNDMLEKVQQSVAQIGDTGAAAAQQMNLQIADMLSQINSNIGTMMVDIGEKQLQQDQRVSESQHNLQQSTTALIDQLTVQVTKLLEESKIAIQSSRQNIEKLNQVSISSVTGMNEGAEKMRLAAERFNNAGQSLSSVTEGSTTLLTQINTISGNLTGTTNQLRTLVTDYQQSRDAVNQAINVLEKMIATAKQEAGMSSQMLSDMQQMTQALRGVQQETQQYLTQVNDVLVKGFDSFGVAVESSLTRSLGAFDNTLDLAVKRLSSGIEDMSSVAEEISEMAQRNARRS